MRVPFKSVEFVFYHLDRDFFLSLFFFFTFSSFEKKKKKYVTVFEDDSSLLNVRAGATCAVPVEVISMLIKLEAFWHVW